MKKLLLTLGACAMTLGAFAADDTVVWTGDLTLSWDYEDRIQVRNDALAGLIEGDQLLFTVTDAYKSESQQWPQIVVRPISDGSATLFNIGLWDDVDVDFPIVKSYTIAYGDTEMLDQLRQGFDIAGANVMISQVAIAHTGDAGAVMPDNAIWYNPEGEEVTWGEGVVIPASVISEIKPGQFVNVAVKSINQSAQWPQVFLCADWVNVIQYMLWEAEGELPLTVSYQWTEQVARIFDGIQMRVRGDGAVITAVTVSDSAEGEMVANWVYDGEEEETPGTDEPSNYGYWYIRGAFNNYDPAGNLKWALMDDDEGDAGVYTGTFEVPAGEFSFNLMNSEDQIFIPMTEDMYTTPMNVTFVDNIFKGVSSIAWDDDEESYYWKNADWAGGQITVSVDANSNNPSIEIYAFPKQAVGDDDLYEIYGPEDGVIAIIWPDYMVWPSGSGAYLETEDGEKIDLARKGQALDYQIYLNEDEDEIPGSITVDLNSLDLPLGSYTLVIPEGYVDVVSEDYSYFESNPEIVYPFELTESAPEILYWYIRGAFNNYDPQYADQWALMDDDEGENGVYTGTFTVPAGEFSFNLLAPNGVVYVPSIFATQEVVFENNTFRTSLDYAFDEEEESYYWIYPSWAGGQITVSVDANTGDLTIYAFPESSDYNEDYTLTMGEDGVITIVWDGAIDDVWYESGNAYLVNEEGDEIALAKVIPGQDGQVTLLDSNPYGLSIDVTNLELEAGEYTLVIPAKYIQIVSDDWETWLYNPEIIYEFTLDTTAVKSIGVENGISVYNLQGAKVNASDINNLNNGIYIINGKKVLIRK